MHKKSMIYIETEVDLKVWHDRILRLSLLLKMLMLQMYLLPPRVSMDIVSLLIKHQMAGWFLTLIMGDEVKILNHGIPMSKKMMFDE
jgi:hypothetical protein